MFSRARGGLARLSGVIDGELGDERSAVIIRGSFDKFLIPFLFRFWIEAKDFFRMNPLGIGMPEVLQIRRVTVAMQEVVLRG